MVMMELRGLLVFCVFMCGLSTINGGTDPSDAAALIGLYTALSSPSQLTGWSSSGNDPCGQKWKGVSCSDSRVTKIKISGLGLSGSLGFQLDRLTSVTDFDASKNNIAGAIPYQLPPNVQRLNLASNNFNGAIPYSISLMSSLTSLNLAHNQLNQQLNINFQSPSKLAMLDLSFNQIPGPLPSSFSSLTSMKSMYLQNNQLSGTIDVLADLPLENLNIENNQFTGWIPQQLQNINLQKGGNSWSSGPAPPSPPGTPPAKSRPRKSPSKSSSDESGGGKKSGISGGAIAGIVISLLIVGAIIAFFLIRRKSRRSAPDIEKVDNKSFAPVSVNEVREVKPVQSLPSIKAFHAVAPVSLKPPPMDLHSSFDEDGVSNMSSPMSVTTPMAAKKATPIPANVKSYSIADLQVATGSFNADNLLGEGSIGRVYRAEFGDGKVLAVKKLHSSVISSSTDDFSVIVNNVSRLHHANVTELVGYCSEHGQHLLVYEFHKNGSLNEFLHLADEDNKPLSWNSRVMIALGSARALEYLHEVCSPSVVHRNFKSENILLDGEMNPHVSDCGLTNLFEGASQNACAPEVAESGQYSLKSDVYSFGVVMLELLTGRKPFDSSRARSEQCLVRWATPQLHDIDALTKMVDPGLEGLYPVKSVSRFADVIALCVQGEPEFRPPMSEVVQALVRLVQRANMSKRTVGSMPRQSENSEDSLN